MSARTLGENVRRERLRCGISQGDLAEAVGVARQTVTYWERGEGMRVEHLLRLCAVLAVSPMRLLPRVDADAGRRERASLLERRAQAKVDAAKRKLEAAQKALTNTKATR